MQLQNEFGIQREAAGAFYCNGDTFLKLSRLEEMRAESSERAVFWGCLTLSHSDYTWPDVKKLDEAMKFLEDVLKENLRKGDIICRWNEKQFYLMLSCLKHEQARNALERIKNHFQGSHTFNEVVLQYIFRPLTTGGETYRRLRSLA